MTKEKRIENLHDEAKIARGKRLRQVRKMIGLTTANFGKETGYSRQAISYWENANHEGLSRCGAECVVKVAAKFHVTCDINWLMYGLGEIPVWYGDCSSTEIREKRETSLTSNSMFLPALNQEMALYKKIYPHAVVIQIQHAGFKSVYEVGDWVGGCMADMHI
jgi:transcriptional regulator with XRE-family HTH domain